MVEQSLQYDLIFRALADGTRRDMLWRVLEGEQRLTDLAAKYSMSLAAVAKHLEVLRKAGLVHKAKHGREQVVTADAQSIQRTIRLLQEYEKLWTARLDRLDNLLT